VSSYREEEVTQNERPIPEDILQFVAEQLLELGPDNLQGEQRAKTGWCSPGAASSPPLGLMPGRHWCGGHAVADMHWKVYTLVGCPGAGAETQQQSRGQVRHAEPEAACPWKLLKRTRPCTLTRLQPSACLCLPFCCVCVACCCVVLCPLSCAGQAE
jgi:hypothetical protein